MTTWKAATAVTVWLSFSAGTLLLILPWSALWEHNRFLELLPHLESFLLSNLGRGSVAGLGVLDFVIGITEVRRLSPAPDPEPPAG